MRTIAVTSGKGGTGKTTVACAIGVGLAGAGRSTMLFDADLALANVDVVLGLRSEFSLQHVVSGQKTIQEVLHRHPSGLRVVTGASGILSLVSAGPKRLATMMEQLAALEQDQDFLIFDTGAGVDRRVMTFLQAADLVLVVVTPDPASVTDAYALIKTLLRKSPNAQVEIVMNQSDDHQQADWAFKNLAAVVKKFLGVDLSCAGSILRDERVSRATRQRRSFVESDPQSGATTDLLRLVSRLTHLSEPRLTKFSERFAESLTAA